MYADNNFNEVDDNRQYVAADGTQYPADYPKAQIVGLAKVTEIPAPVSQDVVVLGFTIDNTFTQVWQTRPKTQAEILAALAVYMDAKQCGGTIINNAPVDTDPNSRMDLTVIRIKAKENAAYSVDWEVSDNVFVTLDAPTCIALADGADAFVQKCYSSKKAVVVAIAQYPTVTAALAAFDNAMKG